MNTINQKHKILLVEDDVRLASLIKEYMEQQQMEVCIENNGDLAVAKVVREKPDLVILDIMLPGKDGLQICREIRPDFAGPILMLTAKNEDIDQVVGLELGADDYVTKPVQPRVLLARIRALLRRNSNRDHEPESQGQNATRGELRFGKLRISRVSQEVFLDEQQIEFTTNEFELLWLLASQVGEVLSRDDILATLRGIGYDGLDRSVDVRISRIRKKLGDDSARPFKIKTIWARGYLFIGDAWE